MVSNIFYFHPYLGKIPILTNIFQMGWNHQLVSLYIFIYKFIQDKTICRYTSTFQKGANSAFKKHVELTPCTTQTGRSRCRKWYLENYTHRFVAGPYPLLLWVVRTQSIKFGTQIIFQLPPPWNWESSWKSMVGRLNFLLGWPIFGADC